MKYTQNPIRIAIADDHAIFRNGFKLMVENQSELCWLGDVENGIELLTLCEAKIPDIVFVDIKMPKMDGIEFCYALKKTNLTTRIIALSMFNEDYLIRDILTAGASGYLLKNTSKQEVLKAIITVYKGRNYYCSSAEQKLIQLLSNNQFNPNIKIKSVHLSERELTVLLLICNQLNTKAIAAKLEISTRTVETYRDILITKTNSKNIVGLVIYAIKNGIYNPHQFE